ncbi:MAG TPA: transcriptional repressor LexA [Nitrososphaera sp.]|nr:transcriptional repressor LexA [Nitrososphaera sp.]
MNSSQRKSTQIIKEAGREGFGKRLREAFNNASNADIARKLGVSEPGVKNYLDGRIPPAATLIIISSLTNRSIHWLLTGEGPKWASGQDQSGCEETLIYFGAKEQEIIADLAQTLGRSFDEQVRELVLESLIERGLVTDQVEGVHLEYFGDKAPRLVPMKLFGEIAAGEPIDVFEEEETVLVAEDFATAGRDIFVLRVRGDSMIDEGILDKDLIICRRSSVADNGDKVVALIDGTKATVKKFYKERGRIRLQPANPRYDPIYLTPDRLVIQGIVIGIQRRT